MPHFLTARGMSVGADAGLEFGGSGFPLRFADAESVEAGGEVASTGCSALCPVHGFVLVELGDELGEEVAGGGQLGLGGAFAVHGHHCSSR